MPLQRREHDGIYGFWCWKGPHEGGTSLGTWFDLPGRGLRDSELRGGCRDTNVELLRIPLEWGKLSLDSQPWIIPDNLPHLTFLSVIRHCTEI